MEQVALLKQSSNTFGQIYPVVVSGDEIIDGYHRLAANKSWRRMNIGDLPEEDKLLLRLVLNRRRKVTADERRRLFNEAAEILLKKGYIPGQISQYIAKKTGFSIAWIDRHLKDKYKMVERRPKKKAKKPAIEEEEEAKKPPAEVRPPKEIVSLPIPLPAELHARLEKYAKDTGESIVNAAIFLIDYALRSLGY